MKKEIVHVYYLPQINELRIVNVICECCPHETITIYPHKGLSYIAFYIGEL